MALSKSISNSVLLIIEKIITIGLAFVTGIFLARISGPETFGEYAYILSFTGLFAPFCIMGLNNITTKYVVKYPNNSHHYVKSALIIRAIGAILSIFIGIFVALSFNNNITLTSPIIQLLVLQSFQLFFVFEYYFLANNQVTATLKIRLPILVFSGLLKILVIINGANITSLIQIHGTAYLLIALGYWWLYRSKKAQLVLKHKVNKHTLLAFFHRGKWLLMSGIAAVIYLKIDQVMLAHYHNTNEVGIYAAAARLSEFWYIFPVLLANAFNRKMILTDKNSSEKFTQFLQVFLGTLVAAAITISFLTYILSSTIVPLIYGQNFLASAEILNIHIFATMFIFQRAILSKWLIIKGLYKYSLLSQGSGAIINIALNSIFIPKWGGIGAAWATLFSYMFASYICLFFSKKLRPFAYLMTKAMIYWPVIVARQSRSAFMPSKVQ